MRVLLDECMPRRLKRLITGHEVATVPEMGWASVKNSRLLRLAEQSFDVFVTVDRNLEYQQNLESYQIAVIVLVAKNNQFKELRLLVPALLETLESAKTRGVVHIGT